MSQLLNGNTSEKNDKIVRLCKPPSLREMINVTEEPYFPSFPNEVSRDIMIHLGCYYLLVLINVNKSFNTLLNWLLKNEPPIFGYGSKEIDSELLERLYNEHKVSLNGYKATCCKERTTPRSMIICSTEWLGDIDPRNYHIFSFVNPNYPKILSWQISSCRNLSGFGHPLLNAKGAFIRRLKWNERDGLPHPLHWSRFNFSLNGNGDLRAAVNFPGKSLCVNVSLGSSCSTDSLTDLFLESNTLRNPVDEFPRIVKIDQCKNLVNL
jgi:hypothetical protein